MREDKGNLWTYPADAIIITTNGTVKKNGKAVMGRGCAKEANEKFDIAYMLGKLIEKEGNKVRMFQFLNSPELLIMFPVKHNWWEKADINLIRESAIELKEWADKIAELNLPPKTFVMPRPGCGNGGLNWKDVKPILDEILDDRFVAITYGD